MLSGTPASERRAHQQQPIAHFVVESPGSLHDSWRHIRDYFLLLAAGQEF